MTPCDETFCECSRCRPEAQQSAVRDVWPDAAEEKRILLLAKYWLSGGHRETARTIRHLFSRVRELEAELRRVRG